MTVQRLETNYGPMFIPDTDEGQWWWLKNTGASPEDELIEMICGLLDEREKGYAVDVGANFGCWTLPLAKHSLGVFSFEPQRPVFECLYRTLAAQDADVRSKITAFPIALGPNKGTISVPDVDVNLTTNFGGISLGIPHPEQPDAPMVDVDVARLDDMLVGRRVSFIKADVEGAELGVLRGARVTIERWKPIIIAEADHPLTDTQALGNYIESLGYNVELAKDNNFIGMPI